MQIWKNCIADILYYDDRAAATNDEGYCWRWSITAHKRRTNTAIGNNDRPLKRGHTAP